MNYHDFTDPLDFSRVQKDRLKDELRPKLTDRILGMGFRPDQVDAVLDECLEWAELLLLAEQNAASRQSQSTDAPS